MSVHEYGLNFAVYFNEKHYFYQSSKKHSWLHTDEKRKREGAIFGVYNNTQSNFNGAPYWRNEEMKAQWSSEASQVRRPSGSRQWNLIPADHGMA